MQFDFTFPTDFRPFRRKSDEEGSGAGPSKLSVILLAVTCGVLGVMQLVLAPRTPLLTIKEAYRALDAGRVAGAEIYAPVEYRQAKASYDSLFVLWRRENAKWRLVRDYESVVRMAVETRRLAVEAEYLAQQRQDSLRSAAHVGGLLLRQKVADFKRQYGRMPIDGATLRRISDAELLLNESLEALRNRNYRRASELVGVAENKLDGVHRNVDQLLSSYLRQLPTWRRWAEETIAWSLEHHDAVIIVDKLSRKLAVYRDGRLEAAFPAEFGPNWLGDKRCRGDGATPEGRYRIVHKKDRKNTRYHLALEIDYPNEEDRAAFELAKQKGQLSPDAQIGSLIEIHGEGGAGIDWTEGCVALRNRDMEKLYNMVSEGTPVTIVGSLNGKISF